MAEIVDPLLQDTSVATFNSILAEAVASEFWIFIQLLKQKVKDSSVLTAEGDALSAIVLSMLPEGRRPGTRAKGVLLFSRPTPAQSDIIIPAGTICAAISDSGSLIEFHRIVFRKVYGEGQDVSKWDVLGAAAQEAELDRGEMQRAVEAGKYTANVEEQVQQAYRMGVSGVPTYVINNRYAVVGAQPYEVFKRALDTLLKRPGKEE